MARRKRGQLIHGWVIIDKSQGLQSTETTDRARRVFDETCTPFEKYRGKIKLQQR